MQGALPLPSQQTQPRVADGLLSLRDLRGRDLEHLGGHRLRDQVLAAPITGTQGARDAVGALQAAISSAEELLGHPLIQDCLDPATGELEHLTIVTDNGPAYKSDAFSRFIMSRPELEHVRTRSLHPRADGVVERFYRTLKYEHLYRLEIRDAIELDEEVETHRRTYNEVRPHESLGQVTPMSVHLADPNLFQDGCVQKS